MTMVSERRMGGAVHWILMLVLASLFPSDSAARTTPSTSQTLPAQQLRFRCDFESASNGSDVCNLQATGWQRRNTTSSPNGPRTDHTFPGQPGKGHYFSTEGPSRQSVAKFKAVTFAPSLVAVCLQFYYFLYSHESHLNVKLIQEGSVDNLTVWYSTTYEGSGWQFGQVTIGTQSLKRHSWLVFEAVDSGNNSSLVAVDDISTDPFACTHHDDCDFEARCDWRNANKADLEALSVNGDTLTWRIVPPPPSLAAAAVAGLRPLDDRTLTNCTGHYLSAGSAAHPQIAIWLSRGLNSSDSGCLSFWYSASPGAPAGSLVVSALTRGTTSDRPKVWTSPLSASSPSSAWPAWTFANASLDSQSLANSTSFRILLIANLGINTSVAIDDISVRGECDEEQSGAAIATSATSLIPQPCFSQTSPPVTDLPSSSDMTSSDWQSPTATSSSNVIQNVSSMTTDTSGQHSIARSSGSTSQNDVNTVLSSHATSFLDATTQHVTSDVSSSTGSPHNVTASSPSLSERTHTSQHQTIPDRDKLTSATDVSVTEETSLSPTTSQRHTIPDLDKLTSASDVSVTEATSLSPTISDLAEHSSSGTATGSSIIAPVLGGVLALLLIVAAIIVILLLRQRHRQRVQPSTADDGPSEEAREEETQNPSVVDREDGPLFQQKNVAFSDDCPGASAGLQNQTTRYSHPALTSTSQLPPLMSRGPVSTRMMSEPLPTLMFSGPLPPIANPDVE